MILGSIDKNLKKMMEEKYDKLNNKLESLRKEQHTQKQRQTARTTSPQCNPLHTRLPHENHESIHSGIQHRRNITSRPRFTILHRKTTQRMPAGHGN
jgi:hypothetical protein